MPQSKATKRYFATIMNKENHKPTPSKKDGNYYLVDHIIRHGGTVTRERGVTSDNMQNECCYHNKDCRFTGMGKSVTMYITPDNNMKSHCTTHAMNHAFRKFTPHGNEVHNQFHP